MDETRAIRMSPDKKSVAIHITSEGMVRSFTRFTPRAFVVLDELKNKQLLNMMDLLQTCD